MVKTKSIRINEDVYKKLQALKHPGQSFNGLLIEMIEKLKEVRQ